MNSVPPAMARVTAPNTPFAPAFPPAAVCNSTALVIQDSSPPSATTDSPAWSVTSSTGIVVPMIL